MEEIFGPESFRPGNEATRLQSYLQNSALGVTFLSVWNSLRVEVQTRMEEEALPTSGILGVDARAAGSLPDGSMVPGKYQHLVTRQREQAANRVLRQRLLRRSISDWILISYTQRDRFSGSFIGSVPSRECIIGPNVFREMFSIYFGLHSVCARPFVGRQWSVGNRRGIIDEHGVSLDTAGIRDLWRRRHDTMKHTLVMLAGSCCARLQQEVLGLFSMYIKPTSSFSELPERRRQGMIPDLLFTDPTGQTSFLIEVKTLNGGRSAYCRQHASKQAVITRAAKIPREYVSKARHLDRRYNDHRDEDRPGPVLSRLATFGRIRGFVFGKFGEVSPDVESFVDDLASQGSQLLWRQMGALSPLDARATILGRLRSSLGVTALRSFARMRLDCLSMVLGYNSAHFERRRRAQSRFVAWRNEYFYRHSWGSRERRRGF